MRAADQRSGAILAATQEVGPIAGTCISFHSIVRHTCFLLISSFVSLRPIFIWICNFLLVLGLITTLLRRDDFNST